MIKTINAFKNLPASKKINIANFFLFFSLFVFFIPLIVLPFFNHASADDYVCGKHLQQEGFIHYQIFFYKFWGGRFAATFFSSLLSVNDFVFTHYYLHSLIMLMLDVLSFYFLVVTVNRFFLKDLFIESVSFLISLIANALFFCCAPDVCTYNFWFTSTITHHLPLIFFYLELISLLFFLHSTKSVTKSISQFILPAFLLLMNGFSEVFVIIQFLLLCFLFSVRVSYKLSGIYLSILTLFFITGFAIAFFSPGNIVRSQLIPSSGIINIFASASFGVMQVFWSILKNPLAWLVFLSAFFYGNANEEKFKTNSSIQYIRTHKQKILAVNIFFLVSVSALCAIGTKGKLVPARYLNSACVCTILLLTTAAFAFGVSSEKKIKLDELKNLNLKMFSAFILCIIFNDYVVSGYKSMLSAPAYNNIISQRETEIKNRTLNKISEVESYDLAFRNFMQQVHPQSSVTYYKWVQQKPEFLFYDNGDSDDFKIATLRDFYNADHVIIKK